MLDISTHNAMQAADIKPFGGVVRRERKKTLVEATWSDLTNRPVKVIWEAKEGLFTFRPLYRPAVSVSAREVFRALLSGSLPLWVSQVELPLGQVGTAKDPDKQRKGISARRVSPNRKRK